MKNNLFNEKTIKRLCSKVKVTPKQKQTAIEWLKLLESGVLDKETKNYFKFAGYVLEDILGYSLRKELDHEQANIEFSFKDSKGQTVLCIEAKGESTDLFTTQPGYKKEQETPFKQTWDDMGRITSMKYGICTNYKDFILIDKSKGYSKYHLFDFLSIKTDENKLKEFIAIFSKENIIDRNFLEKLYEESVVEEREFTKEFYKLFHETRLMMIKEFQDNGASREEAIHFAQIFLNRLMFVFFAKDTGKLEKRIFENLVLEVLKTDNILSDQSKIVSNVIVSLFDRLDEGSDSPYPIFGFNGGLFKESIPPIIYFKDFQKKNYFKEIYQYSTLKNEIELDEHSQEILKKYKGSVNPIILNLLYLASFDFNTEISVNILGHIFEQSISDLEELKQEKVLRRRKEGVYYTPDFITDYICRNTIIPYLSNKGVDTVEKLIDEYSDNLGELEEKFKNLKILDPACGSGSFLIKAVDVLLEIHKQLQIVKQIQGQYTAKKVAGLTRKQKRALRDNLQLSFTKWHEEDEAREIIEKNIFGVDINEESVEITKLSLFFKIVKKNKKLIDLSKNIKCGNSLVDDRSITKNAFVWDEEFPFKFDIVIGNPPYVRAERLGELKNFLKDNYECYFGTADLYTYFYEKGLKLLRTKGKLGLISSNKFIRSNYGKNIRKYLANYQIDKIIDFGELPVFDDASTFPSIVLMDKNNPKYDTIFSQIKSLKIPNFDEYIKRNTIKIKPSVLKNESWSFLNPMEEKIILKMKNKGVPLIKYIDGNIKRGILTGYNEAFIIDKEKKDELIKKDPSSDEIIKPVIFGDNIRKYRIDFDEKYIILTKIGVNIKKYPSVFEHLSRHKEKLEKRLDKGNYWWELRACNFYDDFEKPKLHIPAFALESRFAYDDEGLFSNAPAYIIPLDDKYLLSLLNSKALWFFLRKITPVLGDENKRGRLIIRTVYLKQLPVPECDNKIPFIKKAEIMLRLNKDFNKYKVRFLKRVKHNLNLNNYTKKIENFFKYEFKDFLNELSKHKIELDLSQQDEWEDYFNQYKEEILKLKKQIEKTDNEIDQLVYKLYGLTKEEIAIVEESLKE